MAKHLTLGVDVCVGDLNLNARCELAALLDPPDAMGRDWSILAVKLNLTDQLPEVSFFVASLDPNLNLVIIFRKDDAENMTIMNRMQARYRAFEYNNYYFFIINYYCRI